LRDQRIRAKELATRKKAIQDMLTRVDKKAKNLIDVLSEGGIASNRSGYLVKQIDDLDIQAGQLLEELESVGFEVNAMENKLLSADIIKDNFKVFKDVYDHLTTDENTTCCICLIKKVVYYEENGNRCGRNKTGEIKMDLWELPPIDPSKLSSTKILLSVTLGSP